MGRARVGEGIEAWTTPQGLEKIASWAESGLMLADIANNMGVSRSTLFNWREKSPDIQAALKRGEDVAIERVENRLYEDACNGNTTAQIFYLKNKRPDKWRDKRDTEISGGSGKLSFEWDGKQDKKQDEDQAK